MSRLDDSKKKKLEKEFVKVSDEESGSEDEDRGSDQSDLVNLINPLLGNIYSLLFNGPSLSID